MPVDRQAIENFLYREARLMDENDYDAWLALYADDSFLTDNSRAQQLGWPPSNLASPRSSGQHANGCRITSRCRQHPLI